MLPSLLRPLHSDEFAPVAPHTALAAATTATAHALPDIARTLGLTPQAYASDRRATALALQAINQAHGERFYAVPDLISAYDLRAADGAFNAPEPQRSGGEQFGSVPTPTQLDISERTNHEGGEPRGREPMDSRGPSVGDRTSNQVVDVQTHLVDPELWVGPHAEALGHYLALADPERWSGGVDPRLLDAAAWAALIFGASETAVALLTSTPGPTGRNVLENRQIAAVRDVTDRYAGTGRVLTHTIVHPNLGPDELDRMVEWQRELRPSAWKVYTLAGPPTAASPSGGWFLDDAEIGMPLLERVRELGPRIVCAHKGLGGPIPDASVPAASPRDIGPAAAAFPEIAFVVYHSGYERNPDGQESAFDPISPSGVDRLIATARAHDLGPAGNVYAELGSTWFLMLRRPVEAAHVLGKLLVQFGPERILWGTDSTWYGSPQPLIDAFRAFTIPEAMQEQFGYPALTDAVKARILGTNAGDLYGIDVPSIAPDHPAVTDSFTAGLLDAMATARV